MAKEKISDEQAAIMAPIIEKLLTMMGAARDAFNRRSRDRLQEMQVLQAAVTQNISTASRQVQSLISRKPEAEQKILRRLETLLSRLGPLTPIWEGWPPIIRRSRARSCSPTRPWPRPTISLTNITA